MFLSELKADCHLLICFPCQEGANQLLHQQCLPIFASHQLVVNIATIYFVFYFEKQFPTQACLGWAGCPSGGYFHIVSSLTFHNLLTRGPLKLIKSQTFGFISDNLFGQPAWRKGGKELGVLRSRQVLSAARAVSDGPLRVVAKICTTQQLHRRE